MDDIGKLYLIVALISIIGSFATLWLIAKKSPKGVVLAICVCLYFIGVCIGPGDYRETRFLSSLFRIIGLFGGILGLIDLFRKNRKNISNIKSVDPPDNE